MSDLFLFRWALRDQFRVKKVIAAVGLILLPALFALLQRVADPKHFRGEVVYNVLSVSIVFGFSLVILSAVFGTGALSQEIEQKTIVYLVTRPLPRWRILMARFLASLIMVIATVWVGSLLLAALSYGPRHLSDSRVGRDLVILPVGALAYGSVFLLMAALLNRPLMYALFFAFGWESWVPYLPGNFKMISIMTYLRVLAPHPKPEAETVELADLLNLMNPKAISILLAWKVLIGVIVIALAAALFIFSNREYVPREDAE